MQKIVARNPDGIFEVQCAENISRAMEPMRTVLRTMEMLGRTWRKAAVMKKCEG